VYIPSEIKYDERNEYKMKIKNINKHLSNFFRELADTIDSGSESIPIEEDFDDFQDYTDSYPQNYPNLFRSLYPPPHLPHHTFGQDMHRREHQKSSCIKNKCDKSKKNIKVK
jgi:hypothetical protein